MSRLVSVLKSSLKMAVATFLSRILGLVREQAMAAFFGASGLTDAFLVAYRIPNLLRDLFAEGAFSAAFVPTFVKQNEVSHEKGRELLWSLFIILCLLTGACTVGIFVFAEQFIATFAPAFKDDPEKFAITVGLTKIMSPFLLFISLAALMMGALNSLKVFFIPALAPAAFNICTILCMFGLPGWLVSQGYPAIYSMGIGAFTGGLVQALVQVPLIFRYKLHPMWPKQVFNSDALKVLKLLGPGLVGFAAAQINLLITTILASSTAVGAVSWLNYSFRLFQLPVGILSVSIGNSNLVHFSHCIKRGEREEAGRQLMASYYLSYFVVLPAMVMMLVFAEQMVNVVYQRGEFTAESTLMTAKALRWYALGLPFYGLYKILVPSFYAIEKQRVPVFTSLFSIGLNIGFCLLFVPRFGFEVLALGTTLSMFTSSSIQSVLIKKYLDLSWSEFFSARWLKLWPASLASALLGLWMQAQFDFTSMPLLTKCAVLAGEISLVGITYVVILVVLGERQGITFLKSKLRRK